MAISRIILGGSCVPKVHAALCERTVPVTGDRESVPLIGQGLIAYPQAFSENLRGHY